MTTAPSEILIATPEVEGNLIVTLATQIEQMTEPSEVYAQINEVQNNKSLDDFKLGGLLARCRDMKWYKEAGYTTFKAFLTEQFPTIETRKAEYLMKMYLCLVESEVEWNQVKDIGWSKLARMASVMTKENADQWIELARTSNTTELLQAIKEAKQSPDTDAPIPSEPVVKQNFSLHLDQKEVVDEALEKAKVEAETDFDAVALDAICQNYLSGESVAAPQMTGDLKSQMQEAGHITVLEIFEVLWPNIELHVSIPEEA